MIETAVMNDEPDADQCGVAQVSARRSFARSGCPRGRRFRPVEIAGLATVQGADGSAYGRVDCLGPVESRSSGDPDLWPAHDRQVVDDQRCWHCC